MNGRQLNSYLHPGRSGRSIKVLAGPWGTLGTPADLTFATGTTDSVTQQATGVDAVWDEATKKLTIQIGAGPGLWIPYIGNGAQSLKGVAHTKDHGLGAYTPNVAAGGKSWVATGKFSGCYAATFITAAGGRVFAHIITPADGYPADTAASQAANIAVNIGVTGPTPAELGASRVSCGVGEGIVFWTKIGALWYRRVVEIDPGGGAC